MTRPPRMALRLVRAAAAVAAVLIVLDWGAGGYQERVRAQHRALQARVDRMARVYVRADIVEAGYTPEGRYRITLELDNLFPEYPVFVMTPSVQGAVQVGPRWQEVKTVEATADPRLKEGSVVRLRGPTRVQWLLEIPVLDYFQAFPGYMHVQLMSEMLVSEEPQPREYVSERDDVLFFHLKPVHADAAMLRRANRFPGEPPVFIPTVPRR